jgi:hypothetical protein
MPEVKTRVAAAAAEGRPSFVDAVLNDVVERTGLTIPDVMRHYILADVLKPDDAWREGLNAGRFDRDQAAEILGEAITETMHELGDRALDHSVMEEMFHRVIEDRWHCPFPFVFC